MTAWCPVVLCVCRFLLFVLFTIMLLVFSLPAVTAALLQASLSSYQMVTVSVTTSLNLAFAFLCPCLPYLPRANSVRRSARKAPQRSASTGRENECVHSMTLCVRVSVCVCVCVFACVRFKRHLLCRRLQQHHHLAH